MQKDRLCQFCNNKLKGRTDKKFCDYLCRSSYYNRLHGETNNMIRRVHRVLKQNRRILKSLDVKPVPYLQLDQMGFQFDHCTHIVRDKGKTYFFCYDVGYVPLENNYFAIVTGEEPIQWKS